MSTHTKCMCMCAYASSCLCPQVSSQACVFCPTCVPNDCLHAGTGLDRQTSEILLPPPSNPALMTLTSDGIVRIWIEVVLSPTFGPDLSALGSSRSPRGSPRGSPRRKSPSQPTNVPRHPPSDANMCVGLVIQPPGQPAMASSTSHHSQRVWRACWGVPQSAVGFPHAGTGARAHSVLWLVVMHTAGSETPAQPNAHAAAQQHASQQYTFGQPPAASTSLPQSSMPAAGSSSFRHLPPASQVQQSHSDRTTAQGASHGQGSGSGDQGGSLSLWAIDGLAGVVLGGALAMAAAGGPVPSAPVSRMLPRAMLWGQHHGDLIWPGELPGQ